MKVNYIFISVLTFILFLLSSSVAFGEQNASAINKSTTAENDQKDLAANVELDKERQKQLIHLVKQDCGSCHGMTLQGGLGPALTKDMLKDKPFLLIKNTILYGRPGTAMPPWNNILTEREATWISEQLLQGFNDEK